MISPVTVLRITNWHLKATIVVPNGDIEVRIFLAHPHTNDGFFFLLIFQFRIFILK